MRVSRSPATTRLPLLIWALWLLFCGWIVLFKTSVTTDLTFFLPRDAGVLDAVLIQQLREGPASRLLIMGLEGADESTLARTSQRLADSLRESPLFEAVENGHDPAVLQQLENRLFPYRFLLSPAIGPDRFTAAALRHSLETRLSELASPLGVWQKTWLPRDPGGEWQSLLRHWLTVQGPRLRQGVWFSSEGQRALLVGRTRASGFAMDEQREIMDLVQSRFEQIRENPSLHLTLGGPGPLSVESNHLITTDASRLSVLNSLLVMALLFGVYRSFRLLGLGLIPLFSGIASGVAVTSSLFGEIHGVTLGFGATLIGVAADYPNHFFSHLSPRQTASATMRSIWPTLRLGVLTNIAGFVGMLFSGFTGLMQLAFFASAGLAGAALSSRWIIPRFTPDRVRLPVWVEQGGPLAELPDRLTRFRFVPLLLVLLLPLGFGYSGVPLWNDDIHALSPVPQAHQLQTEQLQHDVGAPDLTALIMISANDAESALQTSEAVQPLLDRLQGQGWFDHYDMAARYLPSLHTQRQRQAALPEPATLARSLAQASRSLPFRAGTFQPFLAEVDAARHLVPLSRDALQDTPLGLRIDSLLLPIETHWVALVPLTGIHDADRLAGALEPWRERGVRYVDLRTETTRMVREYRSEALRLLAASLCLILALLAFGLRSWETLLRVFTPMLAAALCTGLIMALLSGGMTLYHLVSLLLVMGLSLDQALFFNRDAAHAADRRRTLLSLLVCSSSSVLAFGTLALSDINILRAIGSTVALGALMAVVFAAMLARTRDCEQP